MELRHDKEPAYSKNGLATSPWLRLMFSNRVSSRFVTFPKGQTDMQIELKPGDPVIFRACKTSIHPGPRAQDVHPAEHGDYYSYQVDKYWAVSEVHSDGSVKLVTRRGKHHIVAADDPRLRAARWWERWLYRDRFPTVHPQQTFSNSAAG